MAHNASKFTDKGTITLDVQRLQDDADSRYWLRFEVQDTGIGISQDNLKKLFRKYQQANASVARNYGGTGLGLAICDLLVKAMGGRLGVDSVLGEGSTFWFELPFQRVKTANPNSSEADMSGVVEPIGLNILLVEDNKMNQKLAGRMLEHLGHYTTFANHGLEALQKVDKSKYDLVLMDVQMVRSSADGWLV